MLHEVFGDKAMQGFNHEVTLHANYNRLSGMSFNFSVESENLMATLNKAMNIVGTADVAFANEGRLPKSSATGSFTYRHWIMDGRDVYFFSNSTDESIDTYVYLRRTFSKLEWWNPHDGTITANPSAKYSGNHTFIPLQLQPVSSLFLVGQ